MSRAALAAIAGLMLLAPVQHFGAAPAPAGQATEEEVLRQIKTDVFEEAWEAVLEGCEKLIETYPGSPALARTMYYRAKALQNIPGREEEAVEAYGEFIEEFPEETLLREDAMINQMNLAKRLWLRGSKGTIRNLMDYLQERGYPRIYAAIQISHLDNRPARARALPVLKECAENESDAEVRNECTLAILRIDPGELPVPAPPPPPTTPSSPAPPGTAAQAEPKLIRLEVRDKATGKVTVAVNLPIAFAEALLASLSEFDQGQVMDELKRRHIDVNNLWKSLRTLGRQTLVQIETEEANIRIWLE